MTLYLWTWPVGIHLLKVNSESTSTMCEIYPKLTKKKQHQNDVIDVINVELFYWHLTDFMHYSDVSIVDFEQKSNGWVSCTLQGLWNPLKIFQNLYSQPQQHFKRFFRLVSCELTFSFFYLACHSWWQGRYPVQQAAVTTHYWEWQCWCVEI